MYPPKEYRKIPANSVLNPTAKLSIKEPNHPSCITTKQIVKNVRYCFSFIFCNNLFKNNAAVNITEK